MTGRAPSTDLEALDASLEALAALRALSQSPSGPTARDEILAELQRALEAVRKSECSDPLSAEIPDSLRNLLAEHGALKGSDDAPISLHVLLQALGLLEGKVETSDVPDTMLSLLTALRASSDPTVR